MKFLRSLAGIIAGLFVISLVAEGIEFFIVTGLNGKPIFEESQMAEYFAIRNQLPVLVAKLLYTGLASISGGYVMSKIVGRAHYVHGVILALIQIATLTFGMTMSAYAGVTPVWVWVCMIPIIAVFIPLGVRLQLHTRHK